MNQEQIYNILQMPYITEKTSMSAGDNRQYAFRVRSEATKPQIKKAVSMLFNVTVKSVRVLNVKDKKKSFKNRLGSRSGWKKAYVTLNENEEIDITN